LAIARAVIRRPAIYVFDDEFSALDVHNDALVRSRLAEVAADATVIVVAQRISTIIGADQVIVVDDGLVIGAGTHESLLGDCPTYREFAESQSLDAVVGGPR
jgi:ABC-type multidrug transport system fused ATPase/permease subunit